MPIAGNVVLGEGVLVRFPELVNLYGCSIGAGSTIGPFVEIQSGVCVGARCKISSHSFLCSGVTLEDEVFIGHGVMFCNDRYPSAAVDGRLRGAGEWSLEPIRVGRGAAIGSGAVIMPGVVIGANASVGAGAVVCHAVPAGATVAGAPARVLR